MIFIHASPELLFMTPPHTIPQAGPRASSCNPRTKYYNCLFTSLFFLSIESLYTPFISYPWPLTWYSVINKCTTNAMDSTWNKFSYGPRWERGPGKTIYKQEEDAIVNPSPKNKMSLPKNKRELFEFINFKFWWSSFKQTLQKLLLKSAKSTWAWLKTGTVIR